MPTQAPVLTLIRFVTKLCFMAFNFPILLPTRLLINLVLRFNTRPFLQTYFMLRVILTLLRVQLTKSLRLYFRSCFPPHVCHTVWLTSVLLIYNL